jgi:type II secretory pathway component GspD/PulD (secretin)
MVISENVGGTVTLKLSNVPWDQALDVILENAGLGATVEGNVLKIAKLETLRARQTAVSQAAKSKEDLEPLVTRQVFVIYAKAEEVQSLADPLLSSRGEMRIDVRTNSILVTDTRSRVNEIEELLNNLDTRTPQVLIESRIVQATLDFTGELVVPTVEEGLIRVTLVRLFAYKRDEITRVARELLDGRVVPVRQILVDNHEPASFIVNTGGLVHRVYQTFVLTKLPVLLGQLLF